MDTKSQRSYNTLERGDIPEQSKCRILLLGKTGNGKSSLGNAILGRDEFATGRSMSSTTLHVQEASTVKHGQNIKVVDTPDIANVGAMNAQKMKEEVSKWKHLTAPGSYPSAILLAVRRDVRYTAEEYAIYRQIKLYWGHDADFCSRLIVVFTFEDRQDKPIADELREVCPELKSVLRDANNRYVVSNQKKEGNADMLWNSLVDYIGEMRIRPRDQVFDCGACRRILLYFRRRLSDVCGH